MSEFYVSVDIEADGPCPGLNSMLSIGAVTLHPDTLEMISPNGSFEMNFETLPEAKQDPDTMAWWRKQGGMYEKTRVDMKDPKFGMGIFADWLRLMSLYMPSKKSVPSRPVFVAYPAGFDFTFVYYYCHRFLGECPFGFQSFDMKSCASGMLDVPFFGTAKGTMPMEWQSPLPHDHNALNDALQQADMFRRMMRWRRRREMVELHQVGDFWQYGDDRTRSQVQYVDRVLYFEDEDGTHRRWSMSLADLEKSKWRKLDE